MKIKRFEWRDPLKTALDVRSWAFEVDTEVAVAKIEEEVCNEGDVAIRHLTARFDATECDPDSLQLDVDPAEMAVALENVDLHLREALGIAAENIRLVAEAQVVEGEHRVTLPQGHAVTIREVPVRAAGIYVPGGRAAYPSSVLMGCIPARVAGVERVVLASPPEADGHIAQPVLAAAALCGVDEVYAMGGAQAIFALAYGTETIEDVDVVAGPGNAWVQAAKDAVSGAVGIDALAGPSELMIVIESQEDASWAALDLCAQAEHGPDSPLLVASTDSGVLGAVSAATEAAAAERPGVANAQLALVETPNVASALDLANEFAPEHLELLGERAARRADRITTAGCVFKGRLGATAFGDYIAGSNHVLPTAGTGRYFGPLGPGTFRRKISTVEVPAEAAAKLAPHVDRIARAEGFPVHGESAMIRTKP